MTLEPPDTLISAPDNGRRASRLRKHPRLWRCAAADLGPLSAPSLHLGVPGTPPSHPSLCKGAESVCMLQTTRQNIPGSHSLGLLPQTREELTYWNRIGLFSLECSPSARLIPGAWSSVLPLGEG